MKALRVYQIPMAIVIITAPLIFVLSRMDMKVTNQLSSEDKIIQSEDSSCAKSRRESITFILGEDEKGSKPYYSLAFDYYKKINQPEQNILMIHADH